MFSLDAFIVVCTGKGSSPASPAFLKPFKSRFQASFVVFIRKFFHTLQGTIPHCENFKLEALTLQKALHQHYCKPTRLLLEEAGHLIGTSLEDSLPSEDEVYGCLKPLLPVLACLIIDNCWNEGSGIPIVLAALIACKLWT